MAVLRCGHVQSCALYGIEGILVDIEVTILPGLPAFEIVGLGDSAVRESRNRVHAALKNNGFDFPSSRVTASYAPAWLRKEGSGFDLPLALAILIASGQLKKPLVPVCAFGELSLTGEVRRVPGTICRAAACQEKQLPAVLIPAGNAAEARPVMARNCLPVAHLRDAVKYLATGQLDEAVLASDSSQMELPANGKQTPAEKSVRDIGTIIGQQKAVRALQIAAAGRHNLLLLGSPGCGKTSLAETLPGLLPPLQMEEAVLVSRIYSASGLLKDGDGLVRQRPFRSPHHTISRTGMVGGGAIPTPGEISLAHQGVLFLDEMTEFHSETLDLLRQPLEDQVVRLVRLHHKMVYPADFMLVGAANPCRCGEYLEPNAVCRCTADSVRQHLDRLSGPLLDRIDLVVEMTRLSAEELRRSAVATPGTLSRTAEMALGIRQCWQKQLDRCQKMGLPFYSNGRMNSQDLADFLIIPESITAFAADTSARLGLSVRGFHKMLRVARTIADLDHCDAVSMKHMAEAFQYRLRRPE